MTKARSEELRAAEADAWRHREPFAYHSTFRALPCCAMLLQDSVCIRPKT